MVSACAASAWQPDGNSRAVRTRAAAHHARRRSGARTHAYTRHHTADAGSATGASLTFVRSLGSQGRCFRRTPPSPPAPGPQEGKPWDPPWVPGLGSAAFPEDPRPRGAWAVAASGALGPKADVSAGRFLRPRLQRLRRGSLGILQGSLGWGRPRSDWLRAIAKPKAREPAAPYIVNFM